MSSPFPEVVDPPDLQAALIEMRQLSGGAPEYSCQAFTIDQWLTLQQVDEISESVIVDNTSSVVWDCTAEVPGSFTATFKSNLGLVWGSSIVQLFAMMRSRFYNAQKGYNPDAWLRFPLGFFTVTTPGLDDLDASDVQAVTGYDRNNTLLSGPDDTYSFDHNTMYKDAIYTIMIASGVIDSSVNDINVVCDYGGDWAKKQIDQPVNYPIGSADSYLAIINDLLKASGQLPLYMDVATGRWQITPIPQPNQQAIRWTWAGSDDPLVTTSDLTTKAVILHNQSYHGDVYDVPNRWIFIQNGITDFTPGGDGKKDGSSALYQVDNAGASAPIDGSTTGRVVNNPPSDQTTTGRIQTKVVGLDASGQTDLVTQGDAQVDDALANIETLELNTAPWPLGRQYDVFYFVHSSLPDGSRRRLQAVEWEYRLFGGSTIWRTRVRNIE